MNSLNRTFHITGSTDADILAQAVALKSGLTSRTLQESRAASMYVHAFIASENFQRIWHGGGMDGMLRPAKASRVARNRKRQVSRGFSFTIEGREGVYKLTPFNTSFERVNGAWNGHSPNWHERQHKQGKSGGFNNFQR